MDSLHTSKDQATIELLKEKERTGEQIKQFSEPYNLKIQVLQSKIKEVQKDYRNKYREITDAHSLKYGHVSTPEYEKEISKLEYERDNFIAKFNARISRIKTDLENDKEIKNLTSKFNALIEDIEERKRNVENKFQPVKDSLEQALQVLSTDYKQLINELNPIEKRDLQAKKDSISNFPCK